MQVVSIVCIFYLGIRFCFVPKMCPDHRIAVQHSAAKVNGSDWCGHKCILPNEWACVIIRLKWIMSIGCAEVAEPRFQSNGRTAVSRACHTLPPPSRFDFGKFVSIDQFSDFLNFRTLLHITYVRISMSLHAFGHHECPTMYWKRIN